MGGKRARQLVVAEGLEVTGSCEVSRPPVPHRERGVRDFADQRLDECVLAALR